MKAYIDGRPDKDDPPQFEAPGNIVFLAVDKANGARAARRHARRDQRSVHLRHAARRQRVQPAAIENGDRETQGTPSIFHLRLRVLGVREVPSATAYRSSS